MNQQIVCIINSLSDWHRLAPIVAGHHQLQFHLVCSQPQEKTLSQRWNLNAHDYLNIESGSKSVQMAKLMASLEPILDNIKPSAILLIADSHRALAVSMVAHLKNIPVVSLFRDANNSEVKVVNQLSALSLSLIEKKATKTNVQSIRGYRFVGDPLLCKLSKVVNNDYDNDSFDKLVDELNLNDVSEELGYLVVYLSDNENNHYQNINPTLLLSLMKTFSALSMVMSVILIAPLNLKVHLKAYETLIAQSSDFHIIDFIEYSKFMHLISKARLVVSDSGALKIEAHYQDIPYVDCPIDVDLKELLRKIQMALAYPNEYLSTVEECVAKAMGHKASMNIVNEIQQFLSIPKEVLV